MRSAVAAAAVMLWVVAATAATASAGGPAVDGPGEFPTFGVRVDAPAGWARAPETKWTQVGRWVKTDKVGRTEATILLEIESAGRRDLDERAAAWTRPFDGRVQPDTVPMGDAAAYRCVVPFRPDGGTRPRPVAAIIAKRSGCFYVLSLWQSMGGSGRQDLERMRESLAFTEVLTPAERLTMRPEKLNVEDKFYMSVPAAARPATFEPPRGVALEVRNHVVDGVDLSIVTELMPSRSSLGETSAIIGRRVREMAGADGARSMEWRVPKDGGARRWVSSPVRVPSSRVAGGGTVQWVIVDLGEGRSAGVMFTYAAGAHEAAFEAAVKAMSASIEIPKR